MYVSFKIKFANKEDEIMTKTVGKRNIKFSDSQRKIQTVQNKVSMYVLGVQNVSSTQVILS